MTMSMECYFELGRSIIMQMEGPRLSAAGLSQRNYAFRAELRRNNLKSLFAEKRREMDKQGRQKDREEFNSTYPSIDGQSFSQNMDFLVRFSHDPDHNFALVGLGPYLYEHMLRHPRDERAVIVLEGLSEYGELELPWTEEWCTVLIGHMGTSLGAVMRAVSNLLESGSGGSRLRNQLLEAGWVQQSERALVEHKQSASIEVYQNAAYFYLWNCSLMLQAHPVLPQEWFEDLTVTLSKGSGVESWKELVVSLLEEAAHSFQRLPYAAQLLQLHFGELCLEQFHSYRWELTSFLGYYFRTAFFGQRLYSSSFIQKALELLVGNLSSPEHQLQQMTIGILNVHIQYWKASYDQRDFYNTLRQHDCILILTKLFPTLPYKQKIQSLQLLTPVASLFAMEIYESGVEEYLIEEFSGLCEVIVEGLGAHGPQMTAETVHLALTLFGCMHQNELFNDQPVWGSLLDRSGVTRAVQDVSGQAQGELRSLLDRLSAIVKPVSRQQL